MSKDLSYPEFKTSYIAKLMKQFEFEDDLLLSKEKLAIQAVYFSNNNSDELSEQFNESASSVRRIARRSVYKLHTEHMNRVWIDRTRNSFVRSMLHDTLDEVKKLAIQMDQWQEKIQEYSWEIDRLYNVLNKAWDTWMDESKEAIKENTDSNENLDMKYICSSCGLNMGGKYPERYLQDWVQQLCDCCQRFKPVVDISAFGLDKEGNKITHDSQSADQDQMSIEQHESE